MGERTHQPDGLSNIFTVSEEGAMAHVNSMAVTNELLLLERLRAGDEGTFTSLLDQYFPSLIRLAMIYVMNRAIAEEVVQDTWLGVLRGLERFEGRSSLKTWIFHILINTAKTRCQREGRSIPFSSLSHTEMESDEPTVAPSRFRPSGAPYEGGWISFPHDWGENPEDRLLAQETQACLHGAINELLPRQKVVITLRDIEGWSAQEVCGLLGITEANQRVLLHRARAYVRRALEHYFDDEGV
ncbi:MAG: sigma-70 family RNA polymerase sigma factor [Ktedonobacteraceae bacterium]